MKLVSKEDVKEKKKKKIVIRQLINSPKLIDVIGKRTKMKDIMILDKYVQETK
jgi:hypothetical protein